MENKINDDVNILFLKDIGKLLIKEELKYLAIEQENYIDLKSLPIVHNDYLSVLYDYLAYDYDQLDPIYQEKYKFFSKHLIKKQDRLYYYDTKTYTKKNRH